MAIFVHKSCMLKMYTCMLCIVYIEKKKCTHILGHNILCSSYQGCIHRTIEFVSIVFLRVRYIVLMTT
jgi:hypothetical protein